MSFFKRLFGKKEEPKKEVVLEGQLDNVGQEELEELEEVKEVIEEAIQEQVEEVIEEIVQEQVEEVIEEIVQKKVKEEIAHGEEPLTEQAEMQEEVKPKKKGLFNKLFSGLAKTRDNILGSVDEVLKNFKKIDEDLYEELEEALIMADFGVETTRTMMEELKSLVKERKIIEPSELKTTLQEIITNILTAHVTAPIIDETKPNVILVIGVNGVGKTTTIGKLAHQLEMSNKKVVLAAADTFRAAAIEQLQIWADRAKVDLIKHEEGSDPASVVYDGIRGAKARKADVLICDTAGRLQNKANLMKELEKISRIIEREYPEAHKEVLIVLDATTGQNAISQVKVFKEAAKVDGIILTKLDGTAKGGAIVGICASMQVPVKYIGVGEKIEDLQVFDPQSFARALFHVE
ncbi:MAG: signal recognition particle-docking protein FtsY [Cellulosilyticaceae bacterium]